MKPFPYGSGARWLGSELLPRFEQVRFLSLPPRVVRLNGEAPGSYPEHGEFDPRTTHRAVRL